VNLLISRMSPHRIFAIALPLLGLFGTNATIAGVCPEVNVEAMQWLDKMTRSAQEVSYSGVVTFQLGDDMQVMQISHLVNGSAASESLTQLTGQGAMITRAGHPLDCIHPGHKLLRLGTPISEPLTAGQSAGATDCGLSERYSFKLAQGERIAGRKAVRLLISPRDMYRYGYVMELDKQTGLLLKASTVGRGGKVLESFQFANISYSGGQSFGGDNVELVHRATHPDTAQHHREPSPDSYTTGQWLIRWLPRGFMATDSASGADRRRTYTDGLAVFSVFL